MSRKDLLIASLILLLSLPAGCGTRSGQGALRPVTGPDSAYVALVEQALKAPQECDYTGLRMAYAKTSFYDPYSRDDTTSAVMMRACIRKEYSDAIRNAKKILARNFLDARARIVASICYLALGDTSRSNFHDAVARGLIRSILESGDGKGFETAFVVIAVPEEYTLMEVLGLKSGKQVLIEHDGASYDLLDAVDINTDDTMTMYFNVDIPMRWVDKKYR
jgi:hypothetical protein